MRTYRSRTVIATPVVAMVVLGCFTACTKASKGQVATAEVSRESKQPMALAVTAARQPNRPDSNTGTSSVTSGQRRLEAAPLQQDADLTLQVIGGPKFDAGRMDPGRRYEHRFTLRNASQRRVKLEVLRSSCKCTAAELQQSELFPGQETTLTVKWKAEGPSTHFEQSVTLATSLPEQEELQLIVAGVIGTDLLPIPQRIDFSSATNRSSMNTCLRLMSHHEQTLVLEKIRWTDAETAECVRFEHRVRQLTDGEKLEFPDGRWMGEIEIVERSPLPMTEWTSRIEIITNVRRDEPLLVPISNQPRADYTFMGGSNFDPRHNVLKIGSVDAKEGKIAHLMVAVQAVDGRPIKIEAVDTHEPQIVQTTIGEPKIRNHRAIYSIQFAIPPGVSPRRFDGSSEDHVYEVLFRPTDRPEDTVTLGLVFEIR